MTRARPRIIETLARTDVRTRTPGRPKPMPTLREADLARAIERGELVIHYQPIVDLRSGECRRVEALVRWRHPKLGLLLPGQFLPLAAAGGLLGPIGLWVIASATRQWLEWHSQGASLGVSVNISGPEIEGASALTEVLDLLRPVDPDAVTFEMTASCFADPEARVAAQRLAAAGARISIDDVRPADAPGRSLGSALDELKLSRSLVARARSEPSVATDIRALVELARDYRLAVVAVGVEDKGTRNLVETLGCDLAQGYWVSRPLVPDRLGPWRRLAVGVAFGGALTVTAHFGASKGTASAFSAISTPTTLVGFLPSICCLDLPMSHASASPILDLLRERTGSAFVAQHSSRADLYVESSVSPEVRTELALTVDRDMAALEAEFGRPFSTRPAIYVFATRSSFALGLQQMFGVRGPDAGILAAANGGVTLPRQGVIAINLQNLPNQSALPVVRHELTHALVHEVVGVNTPLPAWFDEGLATLEERATDPSAQASVRHSAIALSLLAEGKTSLRDLSVQVDWARQNAKLGGDAYTVAAEAVRLLEQRVGRAGLLNVLAATGRGEEFAAAYAQESGESLGDFESAFPARLASEYTAPRIVQDAGAGAVRWTLAGYTPSSPITITIEGVGYRVEYGAETDRYGMYQAVFGGTAPHGAYTVHVAGTGGKATAPIRI